MSEGGLHLGHEAPGMRGWSRAFPATPAQVREARQRLILDLNVLIAYERGTIDVAALDADELTIAGVPVAEY